MYALSHPSNAHRYALSPPIAVLRAFGLPFLDADGPAAASDAYEDSASPSVWRCVFVSVFTSGSTSEAERWMMYDCVALRFPRMVVVGAAAVADVAIALEDGNGLEEVNGRMN